MRLSGKSASRFCVSYSFHSRASKSSDRRCRFMTLLSDIRERAFCHRRIDQSVPSGGRKCSSKRKSSTTMIRRLQTAKIMQRVSPRSWFPQPQPSRGCRRMNLLAPDRRNPVQVGVDFGNIFHRDQLPLRSMSATIESNEILQCLSVKSCKYRARDSVPIAVRMLLCSSKSRTHCTMPSSSVR